MRSRETAVLLLVAGLVSAGCAPRSTAPPVPTAGRSVRTADTPLASSPDHRTIAYSRLIASSDGPPGTYLLDTSTGHAQWVAPANSLWPKRGRFSSDGHFLACVIANQLIVVDAHTQ